MQSTVQEIDPVTVEVKVEVPWERISRDIEDSVTKLTKTAHVKGFRPGKAPRNIVQKLFAGSVKNEVIQALMEESLISAVRKHELPIVSNASMADQPSLEDGKPLAFSAKFEVRPKIEKLNTELELKTISSEAKPEDIEAELNRLRKEHAVAKSVERPAQKGDRVHFSYTVTVDGEAKPDFAADDRDVELGDDRLLPELSHGLEGLAAGKTKDVVITRGADDANPELAGKTVTFHITAKDVKELVQPELDDEFAKDVGDFADLAALKKSIRERLDLAAKNSAERELREQIVQKFVEANPIPAPKSLIDQQFRASVNEFVQLMRMFGQSAPPMGDDFIPEMQKRSEEKVKGALLLGELSRKESISVSAEEIEAKFAEMAEKSGKHIAKVKAEYAGEKRESLETQLLETKLIDWLKSKAKFSK